MPEVLVQTLARPWHGASDRPDVPAVAALRAQRAEVSARIAFGLAAPGPARCLAWWRLHGLRRQRAALIAPEEAARLPGLPAPPEGALSPWQEMRLRLGLLRLEGARPPAATARALRG
jgi:hypothetical protein